MPLEPGLIGYAALASLALAIKKHRPAPPLPAMPSPQVARIMGWMLVILSAITAMLRFGPAMGVVAWIGQLCIAGAVFVLCLAWQPRMALAAAIPALVLAAGLSLT